jgi:hypothetical protein
MPRFPFLIALAAALMAWFISHVGVALGAMAAGAAQ